MDDEQTDEGATIVERLMSLRERLRTLAADEPESGAWFAMWGPLVAAVARLAKTLVTLVAHLKLAATDDDDRRPIDSELKAELADELRDIADDFPDVADMLFGLQHLDRLWEAVMNDDDARTAATALLGTLGTVMDRFLKTLVDVALGAKETSMSPASVVEFLGRYEAVAQRLLDRWLVPSLGIKEQDE